MVELTINDIKISVEENTTILKAAQMHGIKIPNLCFDKRLRPYGGCRLCVVEVEGMPRLFASCSTPVGPNMIVRTDTPKLRKARQTVLELLLIHHPLDCPICDKAGECDLQDIAYEYGKPEGRFIRHRKAMPPDVRGPLVELTSNRCILCGKCVRICSEHQGRGALGQIGRGFPTVVQPAFGEILECDYCGQCIDICPTGALLSKPTKFQARAWFLEEKDTICPFCGCGCTLTLGLREGKIMRARGKEDNGRSEGNLCGRGRFGFDYIYSENRLKSPLIRKDGILVEAGWDDALAYAAAKVREILSTRGGKAFGAIGSHRCTNEDNIMLRRFMTSVIGSENLATSASLGHEKVMKAVDDAFGSSSPYINLKAPLEADVIFVVESDLSVTHPVFGLNILQAKREGADLIVADVRETKLMKHATSSHVMKPGTSVALLNGITKIIIERNLFDKGNASRIAGFDAFEKGLADFTPEKVSEITGIAPAELDAIAESLAKAKKRIISLSIGAAENTKGHNTVLAACNLLILLGEGRDALQIPAEYANTAGAARFCTASDSSAGSLGLDGILYEKGKINALYIMGEDPVSGLPDSLRIMDNLKSLDLLIVQDIALTETAKLADVVFPASSWAEKDGTFINAEGIAQKLPKVVSPAGQCLPDWQILRNLALALGKDIGVRGIEDLAGEKKEQTEAGEKAEKKSFHPVSHAKGEKPDLDFPLLLVARDVLQHSGTMSSRSKSLDLVISEAYVEIHPDDARKFSLSDNSHVKVTSQRGSVFLKTRISDEVRPGTVCAPTNFPHGRVNSLIALSPQGGPMTVRVEAV